MLLGVNNVNSLSNIRYALSFPFCLRTAFKIFQLHTVTKLNNARIRKFDSIGHLHHKAQLFVCNSKWKRNRSKARLPSLLDFCSDSTFLLAKQCEENVDAIQKESKRNSIFNNCHIKQAELDRRHYIILSSRHAVLCQSKVRQPSCSH